jgi:hypothetical protein
MKQTGRIGLLVAVITAGLLATPRASAHCDTVQGPVVQDARAALSERKVDRVLKWIQPDDESAVRAAFEKTVAVRGASPAAAELADTYFFETLVRLHRAGEGQPYTGLKTEAPEPIVAKADAALSRANGAEFADEIAGHVREALHVRYERVVEARKHANDSVEAGRRYVAAYVEFMHFTEKVSALAETPAGAPGHNH